VPPDCVAALEARIGKRSDVFIREGDANDSEHLDALCTLLDPKALLLAYLDPAKPNLDFATVSYLANRFNFIDLRIDLPFSASTGP
jgi:hypothetical protein